MSIDINAIYEQYKSVIKGFVRGFYKRYGGEFDELEGLANLGFTKACNTYDPKKGSLDKRIRVCMWYEMLEIVKQRKKRKEFTIDNEEFNMDMFQSRSIDNINLCELSQDTQLFVSTLIQDGIDMMEFVTKKKWSFYRMKKVVKELYSLIE